jgi:hypothetical protein
LQRCFPEWVRFHWKFVEYKGQNGFVFAILAMAGAASGAGLGGCEAKTAALSKPMFRPPEI